MRVGLSASSARRPFIRPLGQGNGGSLDANPLLQPRINTLLQRNTIQNQPVAMTIQHVQSTNSETLYFAVMYTKRSKKKHKVYQDGMIIVKNDRKVELQNEEGKKISSANFATALGGLKDGNSLEIGTFELEVQNAIPADQYMSGQLFLQTPAPGPIGFSLSRNSTASGKFKSVRPKDSASKSSLIQEPRPMHDPTAKNAIVLQSSYVSSSGKSTFPIVLDPVLSRKMRPHQHEGVKFLFRCVEGAATTEGNNFHGAILGDSMGLGKSLQSIAIIWTLLKQGPLGKPLAKKAIIVCPASLVQNWMNEVKKWLGFERLKPVALVSGKSSFKCMESIADFLHGNVSRLLIVSYEMFRSYCNELYQVGCGILVCDEGHRLKSSGGNKTIDALNKMPCQRRVILTGTPLQNDLDEFFAMCNFVNPGALGTLASFRTVFANPILASRDTNASKNVVALGQARAVELQKQASRFFLRRSSSILEKYLPQKTETAVFCHLSDIQSAVYSTECEMLFTDLTNSAVALRAINRLRKICSHPRLLDVGLRNSERDRIEPAGNNCTFKDSSKMIIAMSICQASIDVGDRLVVVSNFTSTLDILEEALRFFHISFCRLDGSTPSQIRGDLVKKFNSRNQDKVFLLSSKAGGVGLNIIGANRLILFDPDWNPATDLQAMARIWRDGQAKPVFVYRLLATGTIEEKIFQRQLFKGELQVAINSSNGDENVEGASANNIVSNHSKDINFSSSELRNLFQYEGNRTVLCDTLKVLERSRDDASRENDDGINDPEGALLSMFVQHRDQLEALKPASGVVPCSGDDVLSTALNTCGNASGIVSYLYTARSGDHSRAKRKPLSPPGNSVQKKMKMMTSLAPIIIEDSESGASDEDLDELLKASSCASIFDKVRKKVDGHIPVIDLCSKENSDAEIDTPSTGDRSTKLSKSTTVNRTTESSSEPVGLTWEDALNEIELDIL